MLIETIIQSPDPLSFLGGAVMLDEDGFALAKRGGVKIDAEHKDEIVAMLADANGRATAASEVGAAKILAIAQEVLR